MGYDFQQDPEVSWEILLTQEALEAAGRELADQKVFGWDVETNGSSPYLGKRIIGHAAAHRRPNGQLRTVYAPCRHEGMGMFDQPTQLTPEAVTAAFKPALEGPALKCGHNLNFDVQFARADGIDTQPTIHDTLVAARIIDENQMSYRLHMVCERMGIQHQRGWKDFIKPDLMAQQKALKLKKKELLTQNGYKFLTIPRGGLYAVQDSAYELRLAEAQFPYMGQWPEIWATEMELFWAAVDMQEAGVLLDIPHLERLREDQLVAMAELAPRIWQLSGEEFDITKDAEVRRILFTKLGYPSQGQTKGGKTGDKVDRVDEDALWSLERYHGCQVATLIKEYNASEKITSTYTTSLIAKADANSVLHADFNQNKARTGRASMSDPNLQNIPGRTELGRKVKAAFIARPGMIRYCNDYSQIELRELGHLSQDPLLLKIFREGLDAHRTTAIEAFGTADTVDGIDMRGVAKILNFGIPFKITEMGVQRNINKLLPAEIPPITEEKAAEYLQNWFAKYAGVKKWSAAAIYAARQNNGLFWNAFGRPRRVPAVCSDQYWRSSAAERQVVSTYVQGSAAEIVKASMVQCHKYLKSQTDCEAKMVLMIHDDLQFDMAPEGSAKTARELKRIMESTCQDRLTVPIVVDVEWFTTNWTEKREMVL